MTTTADRNVSLPAAVHPMADRAIAEAWGNRIDKLIAAARAIRASADTLTQSQLLSPDDANCFTDYVEREIIAEIAQADHWAEAHQLYIELATKSNPAHIYEDGALKQGLEQLEDRAMSDSGQDRAGGIIFSY